MFPVSVKWMDGDWVLYQVDASHQGALGQQVTSVNGFSMDQVQEKMAPLISADNEIKLRRQLSQVFGHQEIMVYCGLLKPEEDLTWSRGAIPSFFWICGTTAAAPTGSSSPC